MLLSYDFIEPIGAFNQSPESWDRALLVSSAGVTGFALPVIIRFVLNRGAANIQNTSNILLTWYANHYGKLWLTIAIVSVFLYIWNFQSAFYQIGVKPKVILPVHLNVLFAWFVNVGISYFFALLVNFEIERFPRHIELLIYSALVLSFIASISLLSRSAFLFFIFPFLLVTFDKHRLDLSKWEWSRLIIVFLASFIISLAFIQILRGERFSHTIPLEGKSKIVVVISIPS